MSGTEPVDELAEVLRTASRGADPELTRDFVEAACGDWTALVEIARSALSAGVDPDDLIRACDAARLEIRMAAGSGLNYEDPAEDHVLDLMDILVGWCRPEDRL